MAVSTIILGFLSAWVIAFLAIPSLIRIARIKGLYDEPGDRKAHLESTPHLGGIAIFLGFIFSYLLWTPPSYLDNIQFEICAFLLIIIIGTKDDLYPLTPYKKLIGQLWAAMILVFLTDLKVSSLFGFLGIDAIPQAASILLSLLTILAIINSFNLIDGINGLAGSIAALISLFLGTWFLLVGQTNLAIMGFSLFGALLGFLWYNLTPAKIFMGDSGALFVGIVCSVLLIRFVDLHNPAFQQEHPALAFRAVPAVVLSIFIIPVFDMLRVFTMRIFRGKSPFRGDRSHIHHLLIDRGATHNKATLTLVGVNAFFIFISIFLQFLGTTWLVFLIMGLAVLISYLIHCCYRSVTGMSDSKITSLPPVSNPGQK